MQPRVDSSDTASPDAPEFRADGKGGRVAAGPHAVMGLLLLLVYDHLALASCLILNANAVHDGLPTLHMPTIGKLVRNGHLLAAVSLPVCSLAY